MRLNGFIFNANLYSFSLTESLPSDIPIRDGPLENLLDGGGGEGNFRAAELFFRYQIPCMNFFGAIARIFF